MLTSCDPGVHLGWEKDFDGRVDDQCVERALRSVVPDVTRSSYASEGTNGFPRGTMVTQFYYPDPVLHYGYSLDLAFLPNGKTHYVHQWGKLGTDIPPDELAKVLPLLQRTNEAVAKQCGLSVADTQPAVGPG